jgi:hypothetical protein
VLRRFPVQGSARQLPHPLEAPVAAALGTASASCHLVVAFLADTQELASSAGPAALDTGARHMLVGIAVAAAVAAVRMWVPPRNPQEEGALAVATLLKVRQSS